MSDRPAAARQTRVRAFTRDKANLRTDILATEEPLEIRVNAGGRDSVVAVTMRTPGNDFELAVGFLYAEGVIDAHADFDTVRYCTDDEQLFNVVTVDLLRAELPDLGSLERHFYTSSACGVCGKASLDAIEACGGPAIDAGPVVDRDLILSLPGKLRDAQKIFSMTGGLHAAARFSPSGELIEAREDVGRHNAMDKLVGSAILSDQMPMSGGIVLVSGRGSFELVQKAARAGASIFCAVSAPSSLAVDVAKRFGLTLVGFLRDDSFNVYTGEERISR